MSDKPSVWRIDCIDWRVDRHGNEIAVEGWRCPTCGSVYAPFVLEAGGSREA